jgi:hypothetical protein
MINYMEKNLPYDKVFIFFRFADRPIGQHLVSQLGKIPTDLLLNVVPIGADESPIVQVGRRHRFRRFDPSQLAEPHIFTADEMQDLISDRTMRIVHRLRELFIGELRNTIPDLAVFSEVIPVEMAKGICIHVITPWYATRGIIARVF